LIRITFSKDQEMRRIFYEGQIELCFRKRIYKWPL